MGEKTEEPTTKKLQDARKEGRIAKSQDLVSAAAFAIVTIMVWVFGGKAAEYIGRYAREAMLKAFQIHEFTDLTEFLGTLLTLVSIAIAVIVFVPAFFTAVIGVIQTQGLFAIKPIIPDINKINPIEGFKKIFSMRTIVTMVIMTVKVLITSAILYVLAKQIAPDAIMAMQVPPKYVAIAVGDVLVRMALAVSLMFACIAIADVFVQKFLFTREMRQDKDEVKRDYKELEGNPEIKGRRRQIATSDLFSSPQRALKRTNVVVTNPTHLAIALRYAPEDDAPLPIVTFKGQDEVALNIRRMARTEGIPIVENVALARSLFALEDEQSIPLELFDAVADVLVWVRKLEAARYGQ